MKKSEIITGGIYSNGKAGRFYQERRIEDIDTTGRYKLYAGQAENETVCYKVLVKGTMESGVYGHMTLTRFANWAKYKIRQA